jgi:hypothetical protein
MREGKVEMNRSKMEHVGVGDIPTILESFSFSHFQDFQAVSV